MIYVAAAAASDVFSLLRVADMSLEDSAGDKMSKCSMTPRMKTATTVGSRGGRGREGSLKWGDEKAFLTLVIWSSLEGVRKRGGALEGSTAKTLERMIEVGRGNHRVLLLLLLDEK